MNKSGKKVNNRYQENFEEEAEHQKVELNLNGDNLKEGDKDKMWNNEKEFEMVLEFMDVKYHKIDELLTHVNSGGH